MRPLPNLACSTLLALAACGPSGTSLNATINGQSITAANAVWIKTKLATTGEVLPYIYITEQANPCDEIRAGRYFKNSGGLLLLLLDKSGGIGSTAENAYQPATEGGTYVAEMANEMPNGKITWTWAFRNDEQCTNMFGSGVQTLAQSGAVVVDDLPDEGTASGRFQFAFGVGGRASGYFNAEWCDASLSDSQTCQ